jgi:hypothetical protein
MDLSPFIKDNGFREEKEWRLVVHLNKNVAYMSEKVRQGKSMMIPYIERPLKTEDDEKNFGLKSIIVGPCPHPELSVESVKSALRQNDIPVCEVEKSSIPYRNW